jgi:putative membrane protein
VGFPVEAAASAAEEPVATGKHVTLTVEEQARVQQAVHAAEGSTSAEIVPMIVWRSGLYREAWHAGGVIAAISVITLLLMLETAWLPWGWHAANAVWFLLATATAYGAGWWMGHWPPLIRLLTSAERRRHKVRLRAEQAFLQHGLSQTRGRNGVLIIISLLEHQVHVLADRPLYDRLPPDCWDAIVEAVVAQVKRGDIVGGLCQGIERCGRLLAQYCPPKPGDNTNELPDELIQG